MPDDQLIAREIIENVTDDIDGSADARAEPFSYAGTDYTVDLGNKNRAALEKALKPYIQAGTKVSKRATRGNTRRRRSESNGADLAAVRDWANANGYQGSNRGRIPGAVLEAYQVAQ
jgi:Lsr2